MTSVVPLVTGTTLLTALLVFGPGYLVLRCWAVTGLVAVAAAAPVTLGMLATAAIAAPWAGLRFGPLLLAIPAVVAAAAGLVVRRPRPGAFGPPKGFPRPRWTLLVHAGALLIPATLITAGLTRMIGRPTAIAQTYDTTFHLNAIRYILDTGSGSTLTLGGMYSGGEKVSAYPAAWHDLVAMVVHLSGATIPEAANAVTVVVGALVWPISAIFLVTRATGVRPVPVLFAGALSAVFGAFPYLMAEYGTLYPYFLSLALLPVGLGLTAIVTGVGDRGGTPRWVAALAVVPVAAAIALAHPSTFLALLLLALPIFVVAVVRYRRVLSGRNAAARYWLVVSLLGGYLLAGIALWVTVRPSVEASGWLTVQTAPQAVWEVLTGGLMGQEPTWLVFGLTLVAAALAVRGRLGQWAVGMYLIVAVLFVVASSLSHQPTRMFLTGVWYNDPPRLAALVPIAGVLVCAIAATWLFQRACAVIARGTGPVFVAVAFAVAGATALAGQHGSVEYAVAGGRLDYQPAGEAPLLSPDERALLERLGRHVDEDDRIIGYAWAGTGFSYALSGRRTLTPHLAESSIPPEVAELMTDIDRLGRDPRICALIEQLNSRYVLHFPGRVLWDNDTSYPGLEAIAANPGVAEVDREGDAVLYQVTACGEVAENGRR